MKLTDIDDTKPLAWAVFGAGGDDDYAALMGVDYIIFYDEDAAISCATEPVEEEQDERLLVPLYPRKPTVYQMRRQGLVLDEM